MVEKWRGKAANTWSRGHTAFHPFNQNLWLHANGNNIITCMTLTGSEWMSANSPFGLVYIPAFQLHLKNFCWHKFNVRTDLTKYFGVRYRKESALSSLSHAGNGPGHFWRCEDLQPPCLGLGISRWGFILKWSNQHASVTWGTLKIILHMIYVLL